MERYFYLSLWAVCFYDAIILLLLPSSANFILGTDGSAARYIVDFSCLLLGFTVLCNYGFKPLRNKWIAAIMLLMVISHFHSANISFSSTFIPTDMAIYNYKPMFDAVLLLFMFIAIYSSIFTAESKKRIFKSFCWISVIYSCYMILQRIGIDQIYRVTHEQQLIEMSRNPEVGGFISQPVFAAALLVVCLPFLIKNGSWWMGIVTLIAIILTGNRSAYIASIISILFYFKKIRNIGKVLLIAYIIFLISSLLAYCFNFKFHNVEFSGRLLVWKGLFEDFIKPSFPGINSHYILTGHGIGSFAVLFPFYHKSGFYQAHNEIFEYFYALGVCGMIFITLAVKNFLNTFYESPIFISILGISICSLTNHVFHIPQLAFLTVFLIALAYNKTIGDKYVEAA